MRLIDADAMEARFVYGIDAERLDWVYDASDLSSMLADMPTIDAVPVVRCKDCKHRPIIPEEFDKSCGGINLEFPDDECPCKCSDGWYSWYPPDDFFCARGKQKEDDE